MPSDNCNTIADSSESKPSLHRPGTIDSRPSLAESLIGTDAVRTSGLSNSRPSFEEYIYWAQLTRANEDDEDPSSKYTIFGWDVRRIGLLKSTSPPPRDSCFTGSQAQGNRERERHGMMLEHQPLPGDPNVSLAMSGRPPSEGHIPISNEEYERASRAARTASWSAMFYLMTMDILGPFSVPWAFAAVSFVYRHTHTHTHTHIHIYKYTFLFLFLSLSFSLSFIPFFSCFFFYFFSLFFPFPFYSLSLFFSLET